MTKDVARYAPRDEGARLSVPVGEPRAAYGGARPHLTEAQLTTIWRGRRFPAGALVTRLGVPVNVIFQGRPGRGPGPDFRGAVIAGPSGLPLRGDVELHVASSSFREHGHADDPAYANVILHVVFDDDTGEDTPLPGGKTAPVVALAPWVAGRAGDLERWLTAPQLWREPCHDAVARLGEEGVLAALDGEGDRRFAAKTERARDALRHSDLDAVIYEGVFEAMGYGGNAAAMLALARVVPWQRLGRENPPLRAEALLLGAAGLLPSQRGHRGRVAPHVAALERIFAASGSPALEAERWKLWGVRPQNMPARRIAGCAALFTRHPLPSALLSSLDARTVSEAVRPLSVAADGYWRHAYDPCAPGAPLAAAHIGRARALEILVNVLLPAAAASGDRAVAAKAEALYANLPRSSAYGVTRFIENALGSDGARPRINARRAQGLLSLHRDWCNANGCGRCPLS